MNLFIDTSTLFKLYQNEEGSDIIYEYLKNNEIQKIYLSEITKVEFHSVIWKKVRTKELSFDMAISILDNFKSDLNYYDIIQFDSIVINKALKLLEIHFQLGLRSLDSLQISSSLNSELDIDLIITSDKIFYEVLKLENKISLYI